MQDTVNHGPEDISKRVLEAVQSVPRAHFVPEALVQHAFSHRALPIGHNQFITQTDVVARMTDLLARRRVQKVLEIGTGSGYQTAILSRLFPYVYSIERIPSLAAQAKRKLSELDIYNALVKVGNGSNGWEEYAPFDGVLISAALESVPARILGQVELNGCVVSPMRVQSGDQFLFIGIKLERGWTWQQLESCNFVPYWN